MSSKDIIEYFRSNIFEAYHAYNGWKIIWGSRQNGIVSEDLAERYTEIQNYHPNFFGEIERALLVHFVIFVLHSLDPDSRSLSLIKIDKEKTKKFIDDNKGVLDMLFGVRNKLFAHKDAEMKDLKIPSLIDLDKFFKNLFDFYNQLTSVIEKSETVFLGAESIKLDIENLFMNLLRGENIRKNEMEIKWWEEHDRKISDIV